MAKNSTAKEAFNKAVKAAKDSKPMPPAKGDKPPSTNAAPKQASTSKGVGKDCPSSMAAQSYSMGGTKYNPRVEHTAEAWDKVRHCITVTGKGSATHAQLCEVLAKHTTKDENHHDFIGYMVRRSAITVVTPA